MTRAETSQPPEKRSIFDWLVTPGITTGLVCGLFSAVFYTLSNIALRNSVSVDPFFVASMKSLPTVLFLTPMVLGLKVTGKHTGNTRPLVMRFMVFALVGQVGGNGCFQLALGSVGLAAAVPITLGSILIGSAILGRLVLGETVDRTKAMAILILIFAVVLLSQAKAETGATQAASDMLALEKWRGGIFAAIAGLSYAIFSTNMRLSLQQGMQSSTAMWISGCMGTTALWTITFFRGSFADLPALPAELWWSMAAAGLFNFVAFVAITTAMKVLPIVAVHLLNASQVAMAAIAGVVLFSEPMTRSLLVGVSLTLAGLLLLTTGRKSRSVKTNRATLRNLK